MAGQPFDQEVLNARERPLSSDLDTAFSRIYQTMRDITDRLTASRLGPYNSSALSATSFIADGFQVVPGAGNFQIQLTPGVGFFLAPGDEVATIGGVVGVDDLAQLKPLSLQPMTTGVSPSGPEVITVTPPSSGLERWDIVEVKYNRVLGDPASRDIFNPGLGQFTNTPGVNKTLKWALNGTSTYAGSGAINYKLGTPVAITTGTPANAPAVDSGYALVAIIYVPYNMATAPVPAANITDQRRLFVTGNTSAIGFASSISTSGGGPNKPTLTNICAPPGVQIVSVGSTVGITHGQQIIYILGGMLNRASLVAASAEFTVGAGVETPQLSTPITGTIQAADQALLTGAASSNVTNVGIGTPFIIFKFQTYEVSANPTVNFNFSGVVSW